MPYTTLYAPGVSSHCTHLSQHILTEIVYGHLRPNIVHLYTPKILINGAQKVCFLSSGVPIHSERD